MLKHPQRRQLLPRNRPNKVFVRRSRQVLILLHTPLTVVCKLANRNINKPSNQMSLKFLHGGLGVLVGAALLVFLVCQRRRSC